MIAAVGLVDPSEARYQADKALMQADLRADSRSQLVEKALNLLVDKGSVAKNYDLLRDKLLSKSGEFVTTVVRESAPETGKDGLTSLTTEAVVNVKAVQKSLERDVAQRAHRVHSRERRSAHRVRIVTRDADAPDAPPRVVAGRREHPEGAHQVVRLPHLVGGRRAQRRPKDGPDFVVEGEAKIKRLSMKLEASGLVVTKYALNGWTIKAIDRATRRGDLLQHQAADGRGQLGERGGRR